MRVKRIGVGLIVAVLLYVMLFAGVAMGQERRVNPIRRIVKVESETTETPEYDVRSHSTDAGRDEWLEIRVAYETEPEWVDELKFDYYIYFESNIDETPNMLFKHSVTYQEIKRGKHVSKVYMHPNIYERYVDEIVYIGVEIRYEGKPVRWMSNESRVEDAQWWEKAQNRYTPQTGKMLDRVDTPFGLINYGDYELKKIGDN